MQWQNLDDLAAQFMPPLWAKYEQVAAQAGHGGGDLLELVEFADAISEGRPPMLGIHEGMDMTLPGLVSQQSIQEGGRWIDVPNSRDW